MSRCFAHITDLALLERIYRMLNGHNAKRVSIIVGEMKITITDSPGDLSKLSKRISELEGK